MTTSSITGMPANSLLEQAPEQRLDDGPRLGRIRDGTDLPTAALLLLGGCFPEAFLWSVEDAEADIEAAGARLAAATLAEIGK